MISLSLEILLLNWRDVRHPDAGGAETHMQEIGSRWARMGNSVTLVTSRFPGASSKEDISGVKVNRMGGKYGVYAAAADFLRRQSSRFDVVLESINTVPFFAPWFSKVPVVAQIYSIDNRRVLWQEIPVSGLPVMLGAYALSSLIPHVYGKSYVSTISKSSKARLVETGFNIDKVFVAYPGISDRFLAILDSTLESERPGATIVYLGRLKKYKRVQDVIVATKILAKIIPSIRLVIVGKGDYEDSLKVLVNDLGISDIVSFCGFVSEEEKAGILKKASLFVCTSQDEGGWTISGLEAMAAGVPILVSSSQRDLVVDGWNGYLLESSSPEVIAQRAAGLLQNPTLWRQISSNASRFARTYTWDLTADNTMIALTAALDQK